MVAKCYETGWGGCFFKTIGIFVADECSPRFDQVNKEGLPWVGFKNMEQISDKPTEQNFEYLYRLNRDYPEHVTVASIMGSSIEEWKKLAKMADEAGSKIIEGNFSCPQMTSHDMGSDVGTNNELVESYSRAVAETVPHIPFVAKMTPNCKNMEEHARAALKGGAAAVSAINTIKSITNIDFENNTGMPVVNGKSSISGYSGAAVKPIALRFCAQVQQDEEMHKMAEAASGTSVMAIGCRYRRYRNMERCCRVPGSGMPKHSGYHFHYAVRLQNRGRYDFRYAAFHGRKGLRSS